MTYPTKVKPPCWTIIKEENVIKHLLKHKLVYYITNHRKRGYVRIKSSRDGATIAVGYFTLVGFVQKRNGEIFVKRNSTVEPLQKYAENSGFPDYESWKKFVHKKSHSSLCLYKIELVQSAFTKRR